VGSFVVGGLLHEDIENTKPTNRTKIKMIVFFIELEITLLLYKPEKRVKVTFRSMNSRS
jgi:hypothetical protein